MRVVDLIDAKQEKLRKVQTLKSRCKERTRIPKWRGEWELAQEHSKDGWRGFRSPGEIGKKEWSWLFVVYYTRYTYATEDGAFHPLSSGEPRISAFLSACPQASDPPPVWRVTLGRVTGFHSSRWTAYIPRFSKELKQPTKTFIDPPVALPLTAAADFTVGGKTAQAC